MPSLGRPPTSCLTCRKRKVKCDLRLPRCGSCEKHGWQCNGYKSTAEFRFRDESFKIKQRAEKNRSCTTNDESFSPKLTISAYVVPVFDSPSIAETITEEEQRQEDFSLVEHRSSASRLFEEAHTNSFVVELQHSVDDLALGYFFNRYTYGPTVYPVNVEDGNGCLMASVKALGMAGVAKCGNSQISSPEAHVRYLTAVRLTNHALQSYDHVRRDSTLLAIHILSIFEATSGVHRSIDSWRKHIYGATALLRLRGAEQFQTSTGGRLFFQTAVGLAISCVQQRIALPDHFRTVMLEAERTIPNSDHILWRYSALSLRFVDFYATLLPGNMPASESPSEQALLEAFEMENAILSFQEELPSDWQHQRVETDSATMFTGYYHLYRTSLIAQGMNGLRCMRIILTDIMLKAFDTCSTVKKLQCTPFQMHRLQESPSIVKSLLLDIVASVPQHLPQYFHGYEFNRLKGASAFAGERTDSIWESFLSNDVSPWNSLRKQPIEIPKVRLAGGYLLQWPLYVAGATDVPTGALRSWITGILQRLGHDMGVQHALELAAWLETYESSEFDALHPLLRLYCFEIHIPDSWQMT